MKKLYTISFGEKKAFLKYIEAIILYKLRVHVLGLFLKIHGVIILKMKPWKTYKNKKEH